MILADTSVWINHFRSGNIELEKVLIQGQVVIHPWIIAELALGSLRDRPKTLAMLDRLPQVRVARISELLLMIETRRFYSVRIGLADAQLMASTLITPATLLWTRDKPLRKLAESIGIHASLP